MNESKMRECVKLGRSGWSIGEWGGEMRIRDANPQSPKCRRFGGGARTVIVLTVKVSYLLCCLQYYIIL